MLNLLPVFLPKKAITPRYSPQEARFSLPRVSICPKTILLLRDRERCRGRLNCLAPVLHPTILHCPRPSSARHQPSLTQRKRYEFTTRWRKSSAIVSKLKTLIFGLQSAFKQDNDSTSQQKRAFYKVNYSVGWDVLAYVAFPPP